MRPYGRGPTDEETTRRTVACSKPAAPRNRSSTASTRRDLPTPACATRLTTCAPPSATRSAAESTCASSASRPTSRASSPCAARPRRSVGRASWTSSSRYTCSGSALPFSASMPAASNANSRSVSWWVAELTSVCPAPAADCRRAAVFTASPVTAYAASAAVPRRPATTRPVLMPMCSASGAPSWSRQRSLSSAAQACISSAARKARCGSSSCATGAPKTATTASPMNFSG